MRNVLVVFEGPDHCGKTTEIEMLKSHIQEKGHKNVIFTREPGGHSLKTCEKIRSIILDPENEIHPITEAYLYAASRAQHVAYIKDQMYKEQAVICDRFVYSSLIYQGLARNLGVENVAELNKLALQGLTPDVVFYLKIDVETYLARKSNQLSLDRLEQEKIEFFETVIKGYDDLMNPERLKHTHVIVLDARRTPQEIHNDVLSTLYFLGYL